MFFGFEFIDIFNESDIKLYPKYDILNPSFLKFTLRCENANFVSQKDNISINIMYTFN